MYELALFLMLVKGDYPDSPRANWYKSLKTEYGASCCDISDCKEVDARTVNGYWEVRIADKWYRVPQEKILKGKDNPTGSAVACYSQYKDEVLFVEGQPVFYCFVEPTLF